ncbi:MAG: cation:proton antiporter [Candidatus Omnitrophica bacterium]|nr:cation:proton antiporter [Candidatus Omnitrophota bacterium]MCB9720274.1 cation:proton antiporter [Candidatus Omnitrophota bacterium]
MQMTMDYNLLTVLSVFLAVFGGGLFFTRLKQPVLIAYLLTGVVLGPHGLGIITNAETVTWLGNIGVVMLMFFLGMDIQLPKLLTNWKVCIVGTFLQIAASVLAVFAVGSWLDWPTNRIVLLGFVISLSSTSVILRLLQHAGHTESKVGHDAIGISITQDLAVIPMLVVLSFLRGEDFNAALCIRQLIGTALVLGVIYKIYTAKKFSLPLGSLLRDDEEMQLFASLSICFGAALITAYLGLSTAIGAFVAGMIVQTAKETHWVSGRLSSFKVFLMALFFLSVGMLIDMAFVRAHIPELLLLTGIALVTNTFINAGILRVLGRSKAESLYGGALLAQISEFSFVLAAIGRQSGIISPYSYNMTIALISITLMVSPWWAAWFRPKHWQKGHAPEAL